jgi:hypothetical protein
MPDVKQVSHHARKAGAGGHETKHREGPERKLAAENAQTGHVVGVGRIGSYGTRLLLRGQLTAFDFHEPSVCALQGDLAQHHRIKSPVRRSANRTGPQSLRRRVEGAHLAVGLTLLGRLGRRCGLRRLRIGGLSCLGLRRLGSGLRSLIRGRGSFSVRSDSRRGNRFARNTQSHAGGRTASVCRQQTPTIFA